MSCQYLDKRLFVQLNGSRKVIGVLRGYDVCTHAPSGICEGDGRQLTYDQNRSFSTLC